MCRVFALSRVARLLHVSVEGVWVGVEVLVLKESGTFREAGRPRELVAFLMHWMNGMH